MANKRKWHKKYLKACHTQHRNAAKQWYKKAFRLGKSTLILKTKGVPKTQDAAVPCSTQDAAMPCSSYD